MQDTKDKKKKDFVIPLIVHIFLFFSFPLGILSFASTPHIKIKKKLFQKATFPSGKSVQVFHMSFKHLGGGINVGG